jgi:AGZA family xanthine/uracil permease-like MFS transporter
MGVCAQAGFVKGGRIPRVGRVLLADGVGTVVGSLTGTSTVTSYIESAAGVAAGARTGLSNLVVAALFLVALFFAPLAAAIPAFATAPALILVGGLMMRSIADIEWTDLSEAFPAFLTIVAMPLTFSIATGLSFGVITYTVVKVAAGKHRQVSIVLWILTILFVVRDVYLAIG